jgi:hypothetical protein
MKLLSGLFLGLIAAMGLIRVLEMGKSPVALVGWTLVTTAAIYVAGWLQPRDLKNAPRGEQANREPAQEEMPT